MQQENNKKLHFIYQIPFQEATYIRQPGLHPHAGSLLNHQKLNYAKS